MMSILLASARRPMRMRAALLTALLCAGWGLQALTPALEQAVAAASERAASAKPAQTTPEAAALPLQRDAAAQLRRQQLERLGVAAWHAAGQRGRGVKIAVLDAGFQGYRAHLGSALPARLLAQTFRSDGDFEARASQHGILCGEVIHALAPEAELLLASWEPDQPASFLNAVRWAKRQGAQILTCSLIMPSWSDGEGGGEVNEALARLLGNGASREDLLCFVSAGNTALRHWSGSYRPRRDGWHQWQPQQTANQVTPWGAERVAVELYTPRWCEHELRVTDAATGELVSAATSKRAGAGGCSVVRFLPEAEHRYEVRLRCAAHGSPESAAPFHLVVLGGNLQYTTSAGSIPFPGDGERCLAVGAVDRAGTRLSYSSCGPNSLRPKPDFTAEVPFASLWRARPFTGTSAAAPQAAAVAALWWGRHPEWTACEVERSMRRSALDLGPVGHDWETGYGLIRMPAP